MAATVLHAFEERLKERLPGEIRQRVWRGQVVDNMAEAGLPCVTVSDGGSTIAYTSETAIVTSSVSVRCDDRGEDLAAELAKLVKPMFEEEESTLQVDGEKITWVKTTGYDIGMVGGRMREFGRTTKPVLEYGDFKFRAVWTFSVRTERGRNARG